MADSIPSHAPPGSSGLRPPGHDTGSSAVRPRNRRLVSTESDRAGGLSMAKSSSSLFSSFSAAPSRSPSPLPPTNAFSSQEPRSASNPPSSRAGKVSGHGNALGLLENSLAQSWTSLQGFAASLISGDGARVSSGSWNGRTTGSPKDLETARSRKAPEAWGPPPPNSRPMASDIGAGALADRQAALRAARTASVLESHAGVNGGLDVTGKYKRRTSDDLGSSGGQDEAIPDQLVYIHHVQPTDTYAGIVLRYRCREDPFRKLNGLWSKDIQLRKWLALPVDFCEVKGRASEPPSHLAGQTVDYLAPTPNTTSASQEDAVPDGDFFSSKGPSVSARNGLQADDRPWEHVRWCSLDSFPQPVEIARVSKKAMGYFPPRRKKSLHTTSTVSTPRQSLDNFAVAEGGANSPEWDGGSSSSRRQSVLSGRFGHHGAAGRSTPTSSRGRVDSGGADTRPAWMRRPGGVGSMGRNVRAPGPEKDYFNTWAKRHLPGIAIDEHVPSISVMGSESAHFGFNKQAQESDAAALVESPFDEYQDMSASSRQGSGLDKAAAQVETWLRGAFAKRPSTPKRGTSSTGRSPWEAYGPTDLIELEDTNSDDGGLQEPGGINITGRASSTSASSTGRYGGIEGSATEAGGVGVAKGRKAE